MIWLQVGNNTNVIYDYLEFNEIPFTNVDLWQQEAVGGSYQITGEIVQPGSLLILPGKVFQDLIFYPAGQQQLIEYLTHSHVWVWEDLDSSLRVMFLRSSLEQLNAQIPPGRLTVFIDTPFLADFNLPALHNIQFSMFPYNWFCKHLPRIQGGNSNKVNCTHDYLCTMIKKTTAPHREVLWQEFNTRPGLLDRGIVSYHGPNYRQWVGRKQPGVERQDSHPSMDLYNNCWIEVVPETTHARAYYLTEKTTKPIATRTPFLVSTAPGYLQYLRDMGFKTFHSLIDEQYDLEPDMPTRVRMMVDSLEQIVRAGTEQFYHASKNITAHNYNHLAEIVGKWPHAMDSFIAQNIAPHL